MVRGELGGMKSILVACVLAGLWVAGVHAEPTAPSRPVGDGGVINGMECPLIDGPPPPPAGPPPAPPPGQAVLATGATVALVIDEAVSSARFQRGNCFSLSLAEPIVVDGQFVAPAGAHGVGQVVDSRRGGIGGTPGMLILAARYVMVDGQRIHRVISPGTSGKIEHRPVKGRAVIARECDQARFLDESAQFDQVPCPLASFHHPLPCIGAALA